ncbi:hypothetical protein G3I59_24895 [Amycolatopsis rubida]|uniref:Uncharacterized protein n=1 Tax=Amycolatopsis rubida TaxID=112413 RepID=A0ABX0C114_9PSEU|nr:hypothetical protein [Amycolatopsis rubida]MYW93764.1 hypothetical protein [Amycolatopsis rubida]NEC58751.1 hypothetical protein [Amycolatopsis rubida]
MTNVDSKSSTEHDATGHGGEAGQGMAEGGQGVVAREAVVGQGTGGGAEDAEGGHCRGEADAAARGLSPERPIRAAPASVPRAKPPITLTNAGYQRDPARPAASIVVRNRGA